MSGRRAEALAFVVGAALLAGTWIPAAGGGVSAWESHLFRWINDLPGGLWPVVRVPMQLGSLAGSLAVVAAIFVVTRNRRLTFATFAASEAAYWGSKVVKTIVARPRPAVLLHGVHLREAASGFGYLSGHTSVAVALATALVPSLPNPGKVVAVTLALIVAFARIYAGAHLPLDVLGGTGFGILCGLVARRALGVPPRARSSCRLRPSGGAAAGAAGATAIPDPGLSTTEVSAPAFGPHKVHKARPGVWSAATVGMTRVSGWRAVPRRGSR
jgi:undecaprenyl-diphosphatase